ncbi:MAG: acetylxylan esterase [Armatimonadetes bacterium]|nr:acetylxylan esterase [Armatimonadota bacterium]
MHAFTVGPVDDRRFDEVRHLDMTYSFKAPATREAWEQRAAYLRAQILTGTGLMPMPEKTALHARIFGRIEHAGYTVEKVYFESFPGFYVTGNLYRPRGKTGPFPAVLNPHGHGAEGRLEDTVRSSGPGRAIGFARQGYIAFAYDMIGYNDSSQLKHREDLIGERFRLWGISMGGLQLWNSIRAVDFLLSLPEVDPDRIACTGASGGGTQTFLLTAVDDRVKYSAPVNMISSTMQGGCVCENPPLVRIDTNNMEIGAMAAPRPMIMVSATGDWTKLTPEVEFPAIKGVYDLLGASEQVACVRFDAEHNYNKDSREAVYAWFGRWILGNTEAASLKERPYDHHTDEELLVFAKEPRPTNWLDADGIVKNRIEASENQLASMKPHDAESLKRFRDVYGEALRHALAIELPTGAGAISRGQDSSDDFTLEKLVSARSEKGDAIPALLYRPKNRKTSGAVVVVHSSGKAALFDNGEPSALIRRLVSEGRYVLMIDCFGIGEHSGPQDRTKRYGFFDTYNRTDTMERVQDILTAARFVSGVTPVKMIGIGDAGLWCLLALPFAPWIESAVVDMAGFDASSDQEFIERLYAPCLRRVGDLRTAGALVAPKRLLIHNTRSRLDADFIRAAYAASGHPEALAVRRMLAADETLYTWIAR